MMVSPISIIDAEDSLLICLFLPVQIEVVKSKLHRVTITGADLHYIGSITIDQDLLDAVHMISERK